MLPIGLLPKGEKQVVCIRSIRYQGRLQRDCSRLKDQDHPIDRHSLGWVKS